jgi:hypothetical protein
MFWSQRGIELSKKHLFIAEFSNTDQSSNGGWSGITDESSIKLFVKKIDAPSMNLNFERGLASNYVHYFQQGEINWEPINVTFVDAVTANQDEVPNWRKMFTNYVVASTVVRENRTGMLDLPIFCNEILVSSYQSFSVEAPASKQIKVIKNNINRHLYISICFLYPRTVNISFTLFIYVCSFATHSICCKI